MKNLLLALLLVAGSAQAAPPRVVVVQSDDLAPYVEPVPAFLTALGEPVPVHRAGAAGDQVPVVREPVFVGRV